jgi:tetratricopeptide (TPR) repeat protein
MTSATGVDVVVLGFRNDVARARSVEFLQQQCRVDRRLAAMDGNTPLPHRVCAGMEADDAQRLCEELRQLGAQVTGPARPVPDAAPSGDRMERSRPRGAGLAVLGLLALALAATAYFQRPLGQRRALTPFLPAQPLPVPFEASSAPVAMQAPPPAGEDPAARVRNNEAVLLAQAGQFRQAVDALEAALRLQPDDPLLQRNLQTVLLNWGVAELAAEHVEDAVAHLEEAATFGERAEVAQALGIARLRQGDYAKAAPLLEGALELAPKDRTTLLALADTYVNLDRRPEALDLLHRAEEAGAHSAEIEKRMQQLSREVDAEWDFVQVQDPHFRVSFAGDEDDAAVGIILDALDSAYYAVGEKFNYYPDARMHVVLYTQQDFHTVTQTPDWAGGAFDGRIKIPVRGLTREDPTLTRLARHEYAHSVVTRLAGPRCPVWLNEGLAVWAEELEEGERQTWAEQRIANRRLFSLDQMGASFVTIPRDRVDVAYAQSYLVVRQLVDQYGAPRLVELLSGLGRYGNLNDAFLDVYHENFGKFEQQLYQRLAG